MARRSEHTQQQIKEMVLKAAQTIVIEEGAQALKVRKIAMEIGYTVGSVYMVFDNMDDLIMHIKGETLDALAEQLDAAINSIAVHNQIHELAKAYLQFARQNFNLWELLFIHRLPEQTETPAWYQAKVDALFAKVETSLQQIPNIEQPPEEIQHAARALWNGIHGICILSLKNSQDTIGIEHVAYRVNLLVDCFIRGWATHKI